MATKAITEKELRAMSKPDLIELAKALELDVTGLTKPQLFDTLLKYVFKPSEPEAVSEEDIYKTQLISPSQFMLNDVDPVLPQAQHEPSKATDGDWRYKLDLDFKLRQLEMQERERERERLAEREARDHEFRMAQLGSQSRSVANTNSDPSNDSTPFRVDTAAKLLPKLTVEHEIETYLAMFEKIAHINKWPQDKWAALLQTQLKGKGLKVFAELSDSDCQDYSKLKQSLLTAYEFCPEVYRKRFRALSKTTHETHSDFAFKLNTVFQRWLKSLEAYDNIELLRETFLMEQFMESLTSNELKLWLNDRQPKSLTQMARLADEYLALRKSILVGSDQSQHSEESVLLNARPQKHVSHKGTANVDTNKPQSPKQSVRHVPNTDTSKPKTRSSQIQCYFCRQLGHKISECRKRMKRESSNVNLLTHSQEVKPDCVVADSSVATKDTLVHNLSVHPLFKPYCTTAYIVKADGSSFPIQMLRDTGALQSVVKQSACDESCYTHTGETRLLKGISNKVMEVPLVEIRLRTSTFDKDVLCGLVSDLPEGVDFLFANDLAYTADPSLNIPLSESVITRAQSAAQHQQNPIVDTDNSDIPNEDTHDPGDELLDLFKRTTRVDNNDLSSVQSREDLIQLQKQDRGLAHLFKEALERDFPNAQPYYYVKDGMLMHHDLNFKTLQEAEQIVVPDCLRSKILHLAHDIPASGHLGITKTKARLWPHFCWPKMGKHISHYCKSCDKCQKLGKGPKPPIAPLMPLPVITEPWSRIAIDIVGPLPKCTASNNRFVLTVMDLATHYPEAIALPEHTAPQVAKALSTVFCRFGFCHEILSDQGSDFMSDVMAYFLKEFNINHIRTSPYHPQTNGSCERFHRTMKSMIRALSDKFENSWDECLPWILFAYREIPVESLGFSPFELLFGRSVPGPLSLLKSTWLHDKASLKKAKPNVVKFMLDMRENIAACQDMATEHAKQAQTKSKVWYDRRARERSFQVGQLVLVLLPVTGKPLETKYQGPFRIIGKLGPVDYVISTPNKRRSQRVCHVNMLKAYVERDAKFLCLNTDVSELSDVGPTVSQTQDEFSMDHLPERDRAQLKSLLTQYADIFSDLPGKTDLCTHSIEIKSGTRPIRLSPYRVNPEKSEQIRKELDLMIKMGVIEESNSPWASPVVLIPKADGSIRFCIDYRRVNDVTLPDAFPLPRVEDLIDKIGQSRYLTKIDLSRGYWQVPMDENSIPISAFVTPHGQFQWKYMPFGLRNAPGTFQRLVKKVLSGLEGFTGAYLDDIIIFSDNWQDHMKHLNIVFDRIRQANLTLKKSKCVFASAEVEYLGHTVGLGKVAPRTAKVDAVLKFQRPSDKKQLRSFLGIAGYYRKFIPHFAQIAACLTNLLRKNTKFVWTDIEETAFCDLKSRLASRPILRPPDFSQPFSLAVDASDVAIGANLFQVVDNVEHPVCYYSKRLNVHQQRYSTIEKEALALLLAVRIFSVYFGTYPVTVYTDHSPLQFIKNMANYNQKLLRWSLELQQYNLHIVHRPGCKNLIPDTLSRLS